MRCRGRGVASRQIERSCAHSAVDLGRTSSRPWHEVQRKRCEMRPAECFRSSRLVGLGVKRDTRTVGTQPLAPRGPREHPAKRPWQGPYATLVLRHANGDRSAPAASRGSLPTCARFSTEEASPRRRIPCTRSETHITENDLDLAARILAGSPGTDYVWKTESRLPASLCARSTLHQPGAPRGRRPRSVEPERTSYPRLDTKQPRPADRRRGHPLRLGSPDSIANGPRLSKLWSTASASLAASRRCTKNAPSQRSPTSGVRGGVFAAAAVAEPEAHRLPVLASPRSGRGNSGREELRSCFAP